MPVDVGDGPRKRRWIGLETDEALLLPNRRKSLGTQALTLRMLMNTIQSRVKTKTSTTRGTRRVKGAAQTWILQRMRRRILKKAKNAPSERNSGYDVGIQEQEWGTDEAHWRAP